MKNIALIGFVVLLAGCASTKDQLYYDAAKAISKDNTMSQTACWAAISDIAKGGGEGAKVGAISLADKCKNETMKIERPRNWMGL
jgi:hypothetical protein